MYLHIPTHTPVADTQLPRCLRPSDASVIKAWQKLAKPLHEVLSGIQTGATGKVAPGDVLHIPGAGDEKETKPHNPNESKLGWQ